MVEVRLHGPLAQEFGKVWSFDISSPAEAFRALQCATGRYYEVVRALADKGMVFRVRTKSLDYASEDINMSLGKSRRIDIIPIVAGASAGLRFVIGAAMVAVGVLGFGYATPMGAFLTNMGAALMLGAVTEWLAPKVKREEIKNVKSWTLSGPSNTVDQGLPVPVIYGEVLTGGYPISAGLIANQLDADGSSEPDVSIGGNFDVNHYIAGSTNPTKVQVQLSASPFAMDEPYTYAWSITGFTTGNGAISATLINANKATVTIEITLNPTLFIGSDWSDSFDMTCAMTGRSTADSSSGSPTAVNASSTQSVRVTVNKTEYSDGG